MHNANVEQLTALENKSYPLPYFTDYKTHFFLGKITSKIQVRLILEINIKMSSIWFKIPTSLKNGHIFDAVENLSLSDSIGLIWRQQCTDATNMNFGIHKLANNLSPAPPSQTQNNVEPMLRHCNLWHRSTEPVNLNIFKVICVIGSSTIFLLVASFVMEKIKGIRMMRAINWK